MSLNILHGPSDEETYAALEQMTPQQALIASREIKYHPGIKRAIERGAYMETNRKNAKEHAVELIKKGYYDDALDIISRFRVSGLTTYKSFMNAKERKKIPQLHSIEIKNEHYKTGPSATLYLIDEIKSIIGDTSKLVNCETGEVVFTGLHSECKFKKDDIPHNYKGQYKIEQI